MNALHRLEHTVRLIGVNQAGLPPSVAQAFSCLNGAVDFFRLARDPSDATRVAVHVVFQADEKTLDLICRKLDRVIDVIAIEARTDAALPASVQTCVGPYVVTVSLRITQLQPLCHLAR